ncbi:MAG: DUF6377 domain-containing protein [Rikenellaceae bacterium]|nr:DUF6377 domain-containing protein [Rikenellaceae bacterium]
MNKLYPVLLVLLILAATFCTPLLFAEGDIPADVSLETLDYIVDHSAQYEKLRQAKIDSCKALIASSDDSSKSGLYNQLFGFYYGFQSDSAITCARKGLEYARKCNNKTDEISSTIHLATLYQVTGCYFDSKRLLDNLDHSQMNSSQLYDIYSCYANIYDALEQIACDSILAEEYTANYNSYRDSLLTIDPENVFFRTGILVDKGRLVEALQTMKPYCDSLDVNDPIMGASAYVVSGIYREMNKTSLEKEYLIKSCHSDLMHANREYISLTRLAEILYEEGDIVRAYNYLNRSIEDASYCKALQRMDMAAPMLSIVNTSYKRMNSRWLKSLSGISLVLLLMAVALLVLIHYLRAQRKRLAMANSELTSSQELLKSANVQIRESSNIKNTYITHLMLECIARIESLESYRKNLKKMALASDLDSLRKELKSNDFSEAEWKSFYRTFDTTFLSLFPTFVDDFNKLFPQECQIRHLPGKPLTPELRIYALIRLGIDSTEKIASLLRYSRATIYAYRSRTHLKAFNPDTFEDEVRKIASI